MTFSPFAPIAPGDLVAVVAPAGPTPPERLAAGLQLLAQRYRVHCDHDPLSPPGALSYLAAADEDRARALNRALADRRVGAIFCARGGYGCSRIVERIDADALRARRIPLVGFSDVTVLHAWAARLGVSSVHGPVVTQLADLPASDRQALFDLVEGGTPPPLGQLRTLARGSRRLAVVGPLLGGNLTVLSHLCGTPLMPALDGAILLLEDVGERPYRIDRMLTQLLQAGLLGRLAGVVLGDFVDCTNDLHLPPTTAEEVIAERLAPLQIPVLAGAPLGHGRRNLALPLGATVQLDAEAGSLTVLPGD